ncbi:hypothetical protein [Alteribacillus bidgolensis]|uniref:Uncharacterized protein n=1 Tax=Alteribacillus bidgolensis TaxID=930129 RepID=A0A1G8P5I9_9BACI|nr:hypothetical protein [Alteribacillus bidgolensis]SDI87605.1 hypothetical protein SAMN05216352_113125 [Alteribacillus bidgolensis]
MTNKYWNKKGFTMIDMTYEEPDAETPKEEPTSEAPKEESKQNELPFEDDVQ